MFKGILEGPQRTQHIKILVIFTIMQSLQPILNKLNVKEENIWFSFLNLSEDFLWLITKKKKKLYHD